MRTARIKTGIMAAVVAAAGAWPSVSLGAAPNSTTTTGSEAAMRAGGHELRSQSRRHRRHRRHHSNRAKHTKHTRQKGNGNNGSSAPGGQAGR